MQGVNLLNQTIMHVLNLGRLNLGNNFTQSHLIEAIKNSENYEDFIEKVGNLQSNSDIELTAQLNFGYTLNEVWDSSEFYNAIID